MDATHATTTARLILTEALRDDAARDWTAPTAHVDGECPACRYTAGHTTWCPNRHTA